MDLSTLKTSLTALSPKEALSLILKIRQERKRQSQAWLHEKLEAPKRQAREKASSLIAAMSPAEQKDLLRLLSAQNDLF